MNPESFEDETKNDNESHEQLEFPDFLDTQEKRIGWFERRRKFVYALVAALGVYAVSDFSNKDTKKVEPEPDLSKLFELYTPEEREKHALEEEAHIKLNLEREAIPGKPYSDFWKHYPDDIKQRFLAVVEELTRKLGDNIDDVLMKCDGEGNQKKITKRNIRKIDGDSIEIGEESLGGKSHSKPAVVGFDSQFPGLTNYLGDLWSDEGGFYPKGWINGDINEIKFSLDEAKPDAHYGTKIATWKTAGSHDISSNQVILYEDPNKTKLPKYKLSEPPKDFIGPINAPFSLLLRMDALDYVFSHEIGHGNDWFSDKDINIAERAELLLSVLKRLESPDRFISSYVEAIEQQELPADIPKEEIEKATESNRKKMLLIKVSEYWAEICQQYFSDPEHFKNKYPKDYDIVHNHIKKTDKNFEPTKQAMAKVQYLYRCVPRKEFWDFPFSGERTRFPMDGNYGTNHGETHNPKKPPQKKRKK